MKINCIIIEDEPLASKKLSTFIERLPALNLLQSFDNALSAIDFISSNRIDLIFLDIQMEQLTGIEFLESVQTNAQVIITTAYSEFALKGYELRVSDYLLKPYSFSRFVQAIDKITIQHQLLQPGREEKDFIFVKTEYRVERVNLNDILYIEGMKDYLRLVTTMGNIMTLQRFKTYEAYLPAHQFARVHKSYIVAIAKIESIERNRIKIGDQRIPISETYRERFNKLLEGKRF
ncbi:LytR/AlgR family response regulator transcription factor [Aureispira anguillae]|uniref:LytTR family DNA-binding domain-containing protein n=1 Tax=Aureispira anguillae TaxID=2864201 RepID=A0A915YLJ7_9BACT|nr:LytTR family DNA-binding domain-containing protein [Aureispira anguillae]BDS15449.1 LytTR family DNA-binding domain-containing protein [Aureispira anguillae]